MLSCCQLPIISKYLEILCIYTGSSSETRRVLDREMAITSQKNPSGLYSYNSFSFYITLKP
jgi:hypothetical protein